jgi:hypothetical protein
MSSSIVLSLYDGEKPRSEALCVYKQDEAKDNVRYVSA